MANARTQPQAKAPGAPRRRWDELLAVAVTVFHERGYDGATIQEIADRLGILKGSLYYYIQTKEDLLYNIVDRLHTESAEIVARLQATPDLPALERLALYVHEEVLFMLENVERFSVYYHDQDRLGADRHAAIRERRRVHEKFVGDLILEAERVGDINPIDDVTIATQSVLGVMNWPHKWFGAQQKLRPTTVAEATARFAVQGLGGSLPAFPRPD